MKTIIVDDMLLDMQLFELKTAGMADFDIIGRFTDPVLALSFAKDHQIDFAMLDIDMPGMNGIELAKELRLLRPDIIIVFATAHPKYAVDALKMKADYLIFKPFDRDDIADVIERAKLLQRRQTKRFYFHTFGSFDMLIDGKPIKFHSNKSKELMALCVFFEGRDVSIHDIIAYLYEDAEASSPENTGYRRTIKELTDTLRDYEAEDLLIRKRGSIQVDMSKADSDLEAFNSGDEAAICSFQGAFMEQYSWAETGIYALIEKKNRFRRNN